MVVVASAPSTANPPQQLSSTGATGSSTSFITCVGRVVDIVGGLYVLSFCSFVAFS